MRSNIYPTLIWSVSPASDWRFISSLIPHSLLSLGATHAAPHCSLFRECGTVCRRLSSASLYGSFEISLSHQRIEARKSFTVRFLWTREEEESQYHNIHLQISFINLTRRGDLGLSEPEPERLKIFNLRSSGTGSNRPAGSLPCCVNSRFSPRSFSVQAEPLWKAGSIWQLSEAWLYSFPSLHASFLVGLAVGLGPLGGVSGAPHSLGSTV